MVFSLADLRFCTSESCAILERVQELSGTVTRKRNGQLAEIEKADAMNMSDSCSEFGDNVDLF